MPWILVLGVAAAFLISGAGVAMMLSSGLVLQRQRAAGVDFRLRLFLDDWEKSGAFPILVLPKGGVRFDSAEQRELYEAGKSRALTLEQTPHGHGGAIDVAPYDPKTKTVLWNDHWKWATIGARARSFGLVWGGDFKSLVDKPHIEVPNWKSLFMGNQP